MEWYVSLYESKYEFFLKCFSWLMVNKDSLAYYFNRVFILLILFSFKEKFLIFLIECWYFFVVVWKYVFVKYKTLKDHWKSENVVSNLFLLLLFIEFRFINLEVVIIKWFWILSLWFWLNLWLFSSVWLLRGLIWDIDRLSWFRE
jgi:hypothetical protein